MRRTIGCAALLCALFLCPDAASAQGNPFSSCKPDDPFRFQGNRNDPIPERPGATRITLIGPVEIFCNDLRLFADEVAYDSDTRAIVATGNVALQQPDLQVFAERAEIDGTTKLGTFYNASGTARIGGTSPDRNLFGTQEPDVMFYGEQIARTAPTTYTLRNAYFSTCVQPTPRWEFSGARGTIRLDRYVLLRHAVLRVKDVPLLYLPAIYYPINKEDRSTGFLLPTYGASTYHGSSISNAFFWAIGRSHDATFFYDWFNKTGHGAGSEYRYVASPGAQGRAKFYLLNERDLNADGTVDPDAPTTRSYRLDGDMNQSLPRGFRMFASANYFTDVASMQSYQDLNSYSQRDRSFRATVTGSVGRLRLTATAEQRDIFYGTEPGQRTGRAPSLNLALTDKPITGTRIYYGASGELAYLMRQNDISNPATDASLWRVDANPFIRAPISSLPFLTATGSASWRITRWTETMDPVTALNVPVGLTRQLFDMRVQLVGPVLARVFQTPNNAYATGFKHLIEPSFSVQRTAPFFPEAQYVRVVKNDYAIDTLVGGVTTVNYRLTNRLLARRPTPGAAPGSPGALGVAREILSVELGQSYYSDARAQRSDSQYESSGLTTTSAGTFSPLQLTAISRPTDETSAQFRAEVDSKYRQFRSLSASGTLQSGALQLTSGWSKRLVIEDLAGFDEGSSYHFLDTSVTLHTQDNRLGGTYAFNFDIKNTDFLQQRIVAYYNSQCCGVSFDWQSVSLPLLGIPSDRRFGISFTLAGIGSFSNPLGSFGGQ